MLLQQYEYFVKVEGLPSVKKKKKIVYIIYIWELPINIPDNKLDHLTRESYNVYYLVFIDLTVQLMQHNEIRTSSPSLELSWMLPLSMYAMTVLIS